MTEDFAKKPTEDEIKEGFSHLTEGSPKPEGTIPECSSEDNREELIRTFDGAKPEK